jgi:hypothetical protein
MSCTRAFLAVSVRATVRTRVRVIVWWGDWPDGDYTQPPWVARVPTMLLPTLCLDRPVLSGQWYLCHTVRDPRRQQPGKAVLLFEVISSRIAFRRSGSSLTETLYSSDPATRTCKYALLGKTHQAPNTADSAVRAVRSTHHRLCTSAYDDGLCDARPRSARVRQPERLHDRGVRLEVRLAQRDRQVSKRASERFPWPAASKLCTVYVYLICTERWRSVSRDRF